MFSKILQRKIYFMISDVFTMLQKKREREKEELLQDFFDNLDNDDDDVIFERSDSEWDREDENVNIDMDVSTESNLNGKPDSNTAIM